MGICLERNYQISEVKGFKNNEKAQEHIKSELKNGKKIIAITPMGDVEPTSVESANKSNNLDIFVFTLKEGKNHKREIQSYRIHLPKPWVKEGHDNKRELHMRPGIKKQVDLNPGNNTLINTRTGKTFVITISSSITVSCGKEKFEF